MSTPSTPTPRTGQVVPSVLRAGRILDALAAGPPTATLASLSRQLGYPRSSTLALCNSLVELGLLLRDGDGAYRLGPHTLELSRAFLGQTDLLSEFRRAVAETNPLPEQTLVCSVLRDRDVVYIGNRPGASPLGVSYEVGLHLPAHCTASGLAMLGSLTEAVLDDLYDGVAEFERLTSKSVADLGELKERLAAVRERGYAVDDEETALGMLCVGAAVRDGAGGTAAAVAVSMPKGARTAPQLRGDADELGRLAAQISRGLGAP
jgi:IclR family transcriptional regulator, blcABC operon repressor